MSASSKTAEEEEAFMKGILDHGFFNDVPSPDPISHSTPAPGLPDSPLKTPTKNRTKPRSPNSTRGASSPQKKPVFTAENVNFEEVTAGLDWDDFSDYVPTPQKPIRQKTAASPDSLSFGPSSTWSPEPCTRCVVISVRDEYQRMPEKHVTAEIESTRIPCTIVLKDSWAHSVIRSGDIVHTVGRFSPSLGPSSSKDHSGRLTIDITMHDNLLIVHPDILITPTALAAAPHCRRKPIVSALLRSSPSSPHTPSLLYGNVLHEVFQTCLQKNCWDSTFMEKQVEDRLQDYLGELLRIDVKVEEAKQAILERGKGVGIFGQRYLGSKPKPDAILNNHQAERGQTDILAITKLNDVEDDIWSPKYGLKGKLDASVQVVINTTFSSSSQNRSQTLNPPPLTGAAPLELKTGRASPVEHRAQTILYTLLLSDRYAQPVPVGLLFYTQGEDVTLVHRARNELRALVLMRNEIASWLIKRATEQSIALDEGFLPETIDDERLCSRCYALDACMLYRKAVETVEDTTSPIATIYDAKTSHLTPAHAVFFKKWESLIALEETNAMRFRKEIWTLNARDRATQGRCLADMILDAINIDPDSLPAPENGSKIHRYTYRFRRRDRDGSRGSLLSGHISSGDPITVSVEPDLHALARGYVTSLSASEIVVGVDHTLDEDFISSLLRARGLPIGGLPADYQIVYRIDRDELAGGMGRIRDNLAYLFYAGGDAQRRRLIVDLEAPVFQPPRPSQFDSPHLAKLNSSQHDAIDKVLCADDYALIMGMPGTGKTTVVAQLIKFLVGEGKTILLSAYTHSAVDNILAKLHDSDFGILRLGNADKVHPDAKKYLLSSRRKAHNIEILERQLMTPPVVATTALSLDHELFTRREFDYCIVDEASQITLPTCIGPLRYAKKFVLVGDHFQLPPLVKSNRARDGGFDISLFQRLSEAHPDSVAMLNVQYRMSEDIMSVANKVTYNGRLRCGNETIASQVLTLPDREYLGRLHSECGGQENCWLEQVFQAPRRVIFVNTDQMPAWESRVGDLVQNEVEAELVRQMAEVLVQSGVEERRIGIISVYRQQIKILSQELAHRYGIEVMTADKSQGRDKDCIIVSMVRSNDSAQVGNLVKDWRRMNVTFTRARSKLIIIGSQKTLQSSEVLQSFIGYTVEKGWMLTLPLGAHTLHAVAKPTLKRSAEHSPHLDENTLSVPTTPEKKIKRRKKSITFPGVGILKDLRNEFRSP